MKEQYELVIIGGGPAGLAAAKSAWENGCKSILILERDNELGGILNQCIHNGFGLHTFSEELTGPEYADRYVRQIEELGIPYKLNTMVVGIGTDKIITAMNKTDGLFTLEAKAIILAMGCRERSRGALNIPGYRPAGIFSAGTAQRLVNMEGYMPGKEVVIVGSGDIGLIMARRMTLEGAKVKAVAEILPYSGGLKRNIVQCLNDYDIPLKLSTSVVDIKGKERVTSVVLAKVDECRNPIWETSEEITCDTVLFSCGLIPENELSEQAGVVMNPRTQGPLTDQTFATSMDGIFACGNVLHVHDLVDYVSKEAEQAGFYAAKYIHDYRQAGKHEEEKEKQQAENPGINLSTNHSLKQTTNLIDKLRIQTDSAIRYVVPAFLDTEHMEDDVYEFKFRVGEPFYDKYVSVYVNEERLFHQKKRILTPGEMELVKIKKSAFETLGTINKVSIKLEDN